ncbi:MAG: AMIN domain-containing protein [Nostoc sp. ChiSLP02]|nr:AMIN domain-containing protein [Nostoc sp. DedSLP05]MDZ8101228.1 AMIN domain-containing protein [Nostoc sp. DedSLP01]MDZ8185104.1 AMIN domain-containing protein [Nostoc sp. ChiSLP02]
MSQRLKTGHCHWSKKLLSFSVFSFYAAIALETSTTAATALAKLDKWSFSPKTQRLEITLSTATTPRYFYLAQPPRLVVDLPNTKLGHITTQQNYSGAIKSIRISQLNENATRIVLDLAPGTVLNPKQIQLQPVSRKNPTRWVLRPIISGKNTAVKPANSTSSPKKPSQKPLTKPPQNTKSQATSNLPVLTPISQPSNNLPVLTPNSQAPLLTIPPISSQLPSTTITNSSQPFVSVPPLTPNTPSQQQPSFILPPPSFPNQPSTSNSTPTFGISEFPVPTVPNVPDAQIIEFGQPLPKSK